MAPPMFSLITMFGKKTVPLIKVVPFAKTVINLFLAENRTTLHSGTKTVPKWGPSCRHENGSTLEPFRHYPSKFQPEPTDGIHELMGQDLILDHN